MLVITDEETLGVRRESSLTSARQTEEDGGVAISADVGRAMHAKSALLGHVEVHDTEHTLLHLAGVRGSQNNELLFGEVDSNGSLVGDIGDAFVGHELASIHDGEVRSGGGEILLDEVKIAADQHLLHEEGVVRSGRDHASLDAVLLVPACISIDNE